MARRIFFRLGVTSRTLFPLNCQVATYRGDSRAWYSRPHVKVVELV